MSSDLDGQERKRAAEKPNLDDAARIIRGLLYEEGDDGVERPQAEVEAEATQFLSGYERRRLEFTRHEIEQLRASIVIVDEKIEQ